RFFSAKAGLDRSRVGNCHQATFVSRWCEELSHSLGPIRAAPRQLASDMGSVGFWILSRNRGIWLRRIWHWGRFSRVLPIVSMVDALSCLYHQELSYCRTSYLWYCVGHRGDRTAQDGPA